MMDWNQDGWGTGNWVAMSLVMLLFWVGVVALVVWAVRGSRRSPGIPSALDHAEALLAERFARGEIGSEEFLRAREFLHVGGTSAAGRKEG
jgi:putative membrane protein